MPPPRRGTQPALPRPPREYRQGMNCHERPPWGWGLRVGGGGWGVFSLGGVLVSGALVFSLLSSCFYFFFLVGFGGGFLFFFFLGGWGGGGIGRADFVCALQRCISQAATSTDQVPPEQVELADNQSAMVCHDIRGC